MYKEGSFAYKAARLGRLLVVTSASMDALENIVVWLI
jgi:hypothetical protein